MQKIIVVLSCLLLIMAFSNCSRKIDPEGNYQKSAVITDADLSDWSLPLRFGNKAGTIQYSVTNDREFVYIALLCRDEATEQKILRMGMNVYFDTEGGNSKKTGISFPMSGAVFAKPQANKERPAGGMNTNINARKQELLLQATVFTITGFQHLENHSYDVSDKHAVNLAMKINDDGNLAYEAAIPIKNILGRPLSVNDAMKNFSVGIVIKGFQNSGGGSGAGTGGGGARTMGGGRAMGGGRGMGGSRGMGGGRSMRGDGQGTTTSGNSDRTALLKDDVNWYKFRLAYK